MLYLHSHYDSASSKVPVEIPWTENNYSFGNVCRKGNPNPRRTNRISVCSVTRQHTQDIFKISCDLFFMMVGLPSKNTRSRHGDHLTFSDLHFCHWSPSHDLLIALLWFPSSSVILRSLVSCRVDGEDVPQMLSLESFFSWLWWLLEEPFMWWTHDFQERRSGL